ncbi:MAG: hypothetical protein V3W04_13890 [Gammaproteobacteria bacterium]
MFYRTVNRVSLMLTILLSLTVSSASAVMGSLDIKSSAEVIIDIKDKVVLRSSFPDQLFGFNINYRPFQEQLWNNNKHQVKEDVIAYLAEFPGAILRYPGGLVANAFDWKNAVGPVNRRLPQKTVFKQPSARVSFGIDEYLAMLKQVDGHFWYVLNLVGTRPMQPLQEASESQVARKNLRLAEYLVKKDPDTVHYYQLGNELDRHFYEWSPEKYMTRARKTIKEIKSVDKNAKFVAFLRDFIWTYKEDKSRGSNPPEDLMKTVMDGLPEVKDYSLHHYYNGKRTDGRSRDLTFWLKRMQRSIRTYQSIRGEDPSIWITEHARQMSSTRPAKDLTIQYVSNLGGALSTADYLIAIAQVPQIKGAVWHGLNAGPWQLFDAKVHYRDLRPRPVYWGLRVLRETRLPLVLKTKTSSPNHSGYKGGYDVRAVAFSDNDRNTLGLWLVNYASEPVTATINFKPFSSSKVNVHHVYLGGEEKRDPDDLTIAPNQTKQERHLTTAVSKEGLLTLTLPPASVSNYAITQD